MQADWGADQPYLADPWPAEPVPPERLPAVVAARREGWCLAPEAPVWSFLPAIWPADARAWVPDRSARVVRLVRDGGADSVIPWSAWDHAENERDTNAMLAGAGVPARPFGRLWLLRPPPRFTDVESAVGALATGADAAGIPLMCCAELVGWSRTVIVRWFADGG